MTVKQTRRLVTWEIIVGDPATNSDLMSLLGGYATTADLGDAVSGLTTELTGKADITGTLDQFADVTQTAGKTLAITDNTTLAGGSHSGTNTGDQTNISGNAATATLASTVSVADTTDATCWVALVETQTGNQAIKSDDGISYNASTGYLTASGLIAASGGNVQAPYITDLANTTAFITTAYDTTHAWLLYNRTATKVPFTIQGHASQTAHLLDFQLQGGPVLGYVDKDGNVSCVGLILTQLARHTETVSTPTGTTQTLTLENGNHQTLALTSATGTVTATLTVPSSSAAGTIIIKQHASAAKGITWALSPSGTIKWAGTQPTWESDAVSSTRVVSWRWDNTGSIMILASTDICA